MRQILLSGSAACVALVLAMPLLIQGPLQGADVRAQEPTAKEIIVLAHEARAVWHGLPGFAVEVSISTSDSNVDGRLTVTADGELKLDVPDTPATQWAKQRLQSLVDHRLPGRAREYDVSFADQVVTHPLGRLIKFNGDRMQSVYRIQDDIITEVHRSTGESRFTISVTEVDRNSEEKVLPKSYSVSWWDVETGNLKSSDTITNEWVRVGQFDLPARLLVVRTEDDGQRDVLEVAFRNHQILDAVPAK